MPRHKVTFEFESTTGNAGTAGSKAGWSESWYENSDDTNDVAQLHATILAAGRRGPLTNGWQLSSIRLSQLDASFNLTRKAFIIFVPPADAPGRYTGTNIDEQAYDALEIGIGSAGGHSRRFQMRGIGNDVVSAGSRFLNPAQFSSKFFGFSQELLGNNFNQVTGPWAIRYRTIITPIGVPASGVMNLSAVDITTGGVGGGTPFSPLVTMQGGLDLAALSGATIVIQGVLGMRRLNGSWKVQRVVAGATGQLQLAPKRRTQVSGSFVLSGTARAYTYALDNIISVTPGYGTSRRTGRPLQLGRGRRSNRTD